MSDFKAKCTKFDFGWGSAPDPAGGAYTAPPDSLAGFGGRFAAGEGLGWGRGGKGGGEGREGKWRGGKGRATSYCWTRAPQSLATPLMEYDDPRHRHARWPQKSKVKVIRSCQSGACLPTTLQRKVAETPKLVGRLSVPRLTFCTRVPASVGIYNFPSNLILTFAINSIAEMT